MLWVIAAIVARAGLYAADTDGAIAHTPLAAHPAPSGTTMFVVVDPTTSGVKTTNDYADRRMWGAGEKDLYQEFLFGAIGTGIAVGDYDGDGLPDIFVVSKTESCRLFRNLGNWKFADVTEAAGVADHGDAAKIWKQGATFVDVNNDGLLDLYVCRFNAPNLLYINQGNGTFKESAHAYGLDITDASGMAAFCDYDRDGWLDVYIATNLLNHVAHPNGQRGHLLHNNRNGTFTDVTEHAGIHGESQSHSATWWDFDGDGWPDLYVSNDYGAPDPLYRNNRDGTFTDVLDRGVPYTAFSSMGSDLGDVNNDGLIDLFVADMSPTTHAKDQRSMADSRARFASDAASEGGAAPLKRHHNVLLLNTGTGRCVEAAFLAGINATDWTWSPRLEDLDNDGWLDLHVTNGMVVEQSVDVNTRMMNAATTAERIRLMHASPPLLEANLAFRNRGDLKFENVSHAWGLDQTGISFGSACGDFDGDGNLDLVFANYHGGVTLLRNENASGHRINVFLRGTRSNQFGIGATVEIETAAGRQVRPLVLARGYLSSSEPMAHFGLGAETAIRRLTVRWPSGAVQSFSDLPADQRYTITEPSALPESGADATAPHSTQFEALNQAAGLQLPSREDTDEDVAAQPLLPFHPNRRGPALAVGRVSTDDVESIVIGGTTPDPLRIARPGTDHWETISPLPTANTDDGPVLVFDANGDGRDDLLVTRCGATHPADASDHQPKLYWNDGHGGWQPASSDALPALPISTGAAVAADFDRDGRLDVFLGGRAVPGKYPSSPRSALLANRGGRFGDVTDRIAPALRQVGMVTAAIWSDVDGDGWPDLVVATEWGSVRYFHNRDGKQLEDWTERAGFAAAGTGWWTSLATADFNGDGRPDFVAGNMGLNTEYRADRQHPALLFAGDFAGNGSVQLVEGLYEGDTLYPRRTRRELGAMIPSLFKRFPRNEAFARATLAEVVGADALDRAQRFTMTELRSGVFMSQPDGTYHFEPLPRIAQIAPLQGIVAADLDGDGHADIYAVQNSYAPQAVVGPFDAGLSQLLRGDGRGHFTPVPARESGLVVPGDAKAAVALDLAGDGWPSVVVSRNNGTTLAFRNRGVAGHHMLRVRPRADAETARTGQTRDVLNRNITSHAIGARVTALARDGSTQTAEVSCGSSLNSQSTSDVFFGWVDGNALSEIAVRWPDGRVTKTVVPERATALSIAEVAR